MTDEDVAALIELHGEKQVVAMVLLVAYANFHDRMTLAFGLEPETDAPPPVDVRFTRPPPPAAPRPAPMPMRLKAMTTAVAARDRQDDAEWLALDYGRLQQELERQRDRRPRIKLPTGDAGVIQWGLVCQSYQPELAAAWSACAKAFGDEADQDPIFESTLFWVVARSLRCFY